MHKDTEWIHCSGSVVQHQQFQSIQIIQNQTTKRREIKTLSASFRFQTDKPHLFFLYSMLHSAGSDSADIYHRLIHSQFNQHQPLYYNFKNSLDNFVTKFYFKAAHENTIMASFVVDHCSDPFVWM